MDEGYGQEDASTEGVGHSKDGGALVELVGEHRNGAHEEGLEEGNDDKDDFD